ncbi:MAG: hypothetical protein ABI729_08855 [Chitinophagales bacterium]
MEIMVIAFITLLMNLSFLGCNSCKTDPILLYADKEVLDIGIFKPGTFWVYENTTTGERDSVIVTSFDYRADTIFDNCKDQQVIMNYSEGYYTYSTSFFYAVNYVSTVKVGQGLLMAKENYPADTIFSTAACVDTGYCNVIDTLNVFRKKFANVYQRIDSSADLYDGRLVRFYSAPNYGLIRKEIFLSDSTWETWNLVHYAIVQ